MKIKNQTTNNKHQITKSSDNQIIK